MSQGPFNRRVLTAIIMLSALGFAVFRGWQITSYVRAATGDLPPAERRELLLGFSGVDGLAQYALIELRRLPADAATGEDQPTDGRMRLTEMLLSHQPLSSLNWLELCSRRLATGQKLERVLRAFELSGLTGRSEGYVMYRRAAVGIALWDALPDGGKRTTVNDLAQTLSEMPGEDIARLKQALSDQSEEMRAALRSSLVAAGVPSNPALKQLGL
jgi:hypothetical protein